MDTSNDIPDGAIVTGVDGSAGASEALRWAAGEALSRRAPLHLIYAFNPAGPYGAGLPVTQSIYDDLEHAGRSLLADAVAVAREAGAGLVVTAQMPPEPPALILIEASRHARMIVLGASGRGGFAGILAGSTAVAVSSHAHCATVIVRGDGSRRLDGPVVVGVDGSPIGERAIAAAFEEAARRNAPLVAVHAFSDVDSDGVHGGTRYPVDWSEIERDEQRLLAECLAGWREKYPDVRVDQVVVEDKPRQALLHWAERARLVVVGSRGRGGFAGLLLGSTSQALIHHADCPVMIVRPENQGAR